jgi:hypothetical protein
MPGFVPAPAPARVNVFSQWWAGAGSNCPHRRWPTAGLVVDVVRRVRPFPPKTMGQACFASTQGAEVPAPLLCVMPATVAY